MFLCKVFILLCTNTSVIEKTQQAIEAQLASLPRADIARAAMQNSSLILVESIEQYVKALKKAGF